MKRQKIRKKTIRTCRILFTGMLIASVVFIFANSLQAGAESSLHSGRIREFLNVILEPVGIGPLTAHFVRKLAHFTEFAMMGFSMLLCVWSYTLTRGSHIGWMLFFSLMTAVLDENLQRFIPERGPSTTDILIDFSGAACGFLLALLVLSLVLHMAAHRSIKNKR